MKDRQTREITLQGHRLVRERYIMGKAFDGNRPHHNQHDTQHNNERRGPRRNELVMHLIAREDDNRPAEVQSLERTQISEVKCKRDIVMTDKPYPMLSFRDKQFSSTYAHLIGFPEADQQAYLFQNGPLVCRWTRTSIVSPNGKINGGVFRFHSEKGSFLPGHLRQTPDVRREPHGKTFVPAQRHRKTASLQEMDVTVTPRSSQPSKIKRYTFFDMYCGGGGASRGAHQAGLKILGGLDHDETAMHAWSENYPDAIPLRMESFDFVNKDAEFWKIIGRCDFVNISNPCPTFSPMQ